eukprot:PhF_6_TR22330/c1_g1_i1/m.31615
MVFEFLQQPYLTILHPDDDVFVRVRKFIFTCLLSLAPLSLLGTFVFFVAASYDTWTPIVICCCALWVTATLYTCTPWLYLYSNRWPWTDGATDVVLVLANVLVWLPCFLCRLPSLTALFFLLMVLTILCSPRHIGPHLLFTFVLMGINQYNVDMFDAGLTDTELRIPNAWRPTKVFSLYMVASWSAWCFVAYGIFTVYAEYAESIRKASKTAALCYAVAEKMVMYDTQAAQELL